VSLSRNTGDVVPPNSIGGTVLAALFIGERFEYQIAVDDQRTIILYGERHEPLEEKDKIWLSLRPDGHSIWSTDVSESEQEA